MLVLSYPNPIYLFHPSITVNYHITGVNYVHVHYQCTFIAEPVNIMSTIYYCIPIYIPCIHLNQANTTIIRSLLLTHSHSLTTLAHMCSIINYHHIYMSYHTHHITNMIHGVCGSHINIAAVHV
jgi:hypothetical protein